MGASCGGGASGSAWPPRSCAATRAYKASPLVVHETANARGVPMNLPCP